MRSPPVVRGSGPPPGARGLLHLVQQMVEAGGTDLHLKVPGRPMIRVGGALLPMPFDRLAPGDTAAYAQGVLEVAGSDTMLGSTQDLRVAFSVDGVGRFRAQLARQRGTFEIVVHRIALSPPVASDFPGLAPLPEVLDGAPGLFLVGGGRHRRAVIAAIVAAFNARCWGRLVSIEDPVEWLHRDERATLSQREIGTDVRSFAEGLSAAMRQDADAVVVSDVPTAEDADALLRAAEEGLHVFGGLPVADPDDAVLALAGRFAPGREREVSARIASVLRGVVVVDHGGTVTWKRIDAGQRAALRAGHLSLVG
jgi:twitching motility protein PilT